MDGPELSCTALHLAFNPITLLKRYSSEEAFKNADGLARGELAGKVEMRAMLQTPAELQGSEESPVPLLVQLWSGIPAPPQTLSHTTATSHFTGHIQSFMVRSRCTYTTKESITSQIIYCYKRGKLSPAHVATRTVQDC